LDLATGTAKLTITASAGISGMVSFMCSGCPAQSTAPLPGKACGKPGHGEHYYSFDQYDFGGRRCGTGREKNVCAGAAMHHSLVQRRPTPVDQSVSSGRSICTGWSGPCGMRRQQVTTDLPRWRQPYRQLHPHVNSYVPDRGVPQSRIRCRWR